jgi:outer membrane protein OmpA-like peptidoglycan-associated protein
MLAPGAPGLRRPDDPVFGAPTMRQQVVGVCIAALVAAGGLAVSGCATHEDVENAVAEHNAQNDQQFAHRQGQHNAQQGEIDQLKGESAAALARAEAAHKLASVDFKHEVVFTDDSVKFDTGKADLTAEAQAALTAFAEKVKATNKNVFIEIEGHADSRGSATSNNALAAKRAEATRQYLRDQGIPLNRMETVSYGETRPTSTGDAEDRRVVMVVLI